MYVLNQNQKNFITSSKIRKLMAVLDISAEDLCKNIGIDFHDFSEALNGNKKFNINQREAVFHSVKNAVDDNFKFADSCSCSSLLYCIVPILPFYFSLI